MDKYTYIANAHTAYIDELYQSFLENPESVDESWQRFFEGFEFSLHKYGEDPMVENGVATPNTTLSSDFDIKKEVKVRNLIYAYRGRGHLISKTNPVRERRNRRARLSLEDFDLSEQDLDTVFQSGISITGEPMTLRKIIETLDYIYGKSIGFEYMYIREPEVVSWFKKKVEKDSLAYQPTNEVAQRILFKLNEAAVFENFLHTKYIGQKRFSLEGVETAIPTLDALVNHAADLGAEEVVVGMAHRGRLNVLVNIMGKTYEDIFHEFEGSLPDTTEGDGDVKYHLGFSSDVITPNGKKIHLELTPNPSHLEAVNPLVEGYTRAKCDSIYHGNADKIIPVLIHGDAAVAGQGIVYEVTQMANLEGYYTGGTIHIVINNQVGFTTDFQEARSSIYCTDVAKIIDAPVLHVNGDNPEAAVFAIKLAVEFRQRYNRDIFIDIVGYRKYGHNESDEPKFTQPKLYNIIEKHSSVREIYIQTLKERGEVTADLAKQMEREFKKMLQDRFNQVKQKEVPYTLQTLQLEWEKLRTSTPSDFDKSPETGIPKEEIIKIAQALCKVPEGFTPLKQIIRLMKQREEMFFRSEKLDWASAELLAYGSILTDGKIVRLSGQDVRRGTFSHRHAAIMDKGTNERYDTLDYIEDTQEKMRIYNSHLSEYAVLGFEFGYSLANPNSLVIWEAQFGDFANGAQVMIDQFIASAESKWHIMAGLVMLLPHGYEGQGPEHSSARLERFLQLSAEYNMVVVNITKPANLFHALRRQLTWDFRKPLIVMSPKSLLRHQEVFSPLSEFENGSFQEFYEDDYADVKKVKRVLMCSGKVYYDLLKKQQEDKRNDVAIMRIEQLHPFPAKDVHLRIAKYRSAKEIFWVQEEPLNMGAWTYIQRVYKFDKLDVISRKASASPATGYKKMHEKEQNEIIKKAFK